MACSCSLTLKLRRLEPGARPIWGAVIDACTRRCTHVGEVQSRARPTKAAVGLVLRRERFCDQGLMSPVTLDTLIGQLCSCGFGAMRQLMLACGRSHP